MNCPVAARAFSNLQTLQEYLSECICGQTNLKLVASSIMPRIPCVLERLAHTDAVDMFVQT